MALPGACYVWMLLCNVQCKEEKGVVCVLITPTYFDTQYRVVYAEQYIRM